VVLGWYIWAVVFVLFNFTQYLRVKREEQVLAEAFGDEYQDYKEKTWF
jgi:protein-S-isoprenylcysteine O-methyltransferase Ste14